MKNNKVVYAWYADNLPFYIGIGTIERSKNNKRRNKYCLNKRAKAERENCFEIIILHENLSWKEACELEQSYISLYGRKDNKTGILTNMTNGGEGRVNSKQSEQTKRKISDTLTGRKRDAAICQKISESSKGKTFSLESRKKMSDSTKGENHPNYGKRLSEETKKKIRRKRKPTGFCSNRVKVVTPLGTFESAKTAAIAHKVSSQCILNRIKNERFLEYLKSA